MEKEVLGIVDYILFTLMLLVSAGIGVFFGFSGGKQKTTEEYLLAGQDMSILPVAFSLMASFMSAISVMGFPTEMYRFGTHFAFSNFGSAVAIAVSSYIFLPVYFQTGIRTVYEYLERRFGKTTRTLASFAFLLQMILYTSVVLYAPALALSAVTNLPTWMSVVSIGVVCTFYCTLGGMKAVLWTDVFQAVLMYLGIFTVLIKGILDLGGIKNVFQKANERGRLLIPGLELDLTVRYTMWNVLMQGFFSATSSYGGNQVQIQRLLTVKNISRARIALFISIPMTFFYRMLASLTGLVMHAYFAECDPLTAPNKPISKADQLLPYYMIHSLQSYPGLPGLCICVIFSASLSSISSAVNSLTAVTMQDILRPYFLSQHTMKKTAFFAKIVTIFYGVLCVALTFLVASLGNLLQALMTVFGMLGCPVVGVIFAGMMTQRVNEKGAIIGLLSGIAFSAWISFGAAANAPPPKVLPVSTEGCKLLNSTLPQDSVFTLLNITNMSVIKDSSSVQSIITSTPKTFYEDVFFLYRISYMWYSFIGFASSLIIAYITSVLFNLITGKTNEVPDVLLSPASEIFHHKSSISIKSKVNTSETRQLRKARTHGMSESQ